MLIETWAETDMLEGTEVTEGLLFSPIGCDAGAASALKKASSLGVPKEV